MPRSAEHNWANDHEEVLTFGEVLADAGEFDAPKDLLYFFQKPWKWTIEHISWIDAGRPTGRDAVDWLAHYREAPDPNDQVAMGAKDYG
jgi:hypothetical protein